MLDIVYSYPCTGSAEKELEAINKMYMEKTANFNELLDACITYIGASRVWGFGYYFIIIIIIICVCVIIFTFHRNM